MAWPWLRILEFGSRIRYCILEHTNLQKVDYPENHHLWRPQDHTPLRRSHRTPPTTSRPETYTHETSSQSARFFPFSKRFLPFPYHPTAQRALDSTTQLARFACIYPFPVFSGKTGRLFSLLPLYLSHRPILSLCLVLLLLVFFIRIPALEAQYGSLVGWGFWMVEGNARNG